MLSTVRDLKASGTEANGRPFASLLVVKKLTSKTASNGNLFYSVDLGDRTGSFGCTIFSDNPAFEILKTGGEGAVVRIEEKSTTIKDVCPRKSPAPMCCPKTNSAIRVCSKPWSKLHRKTR